MFVLIFIFWLIAMVFFKFKSPNVNLIDVSCNVYAVVATADVQYSFIF